MKEIENKAKNGTKCERRRFLGSVGLETLLISGNPLVAVLACERDGPLIRFGDVMAKCPPTSGEGKVSRLSLEVSGGPVHSTPLLVEPMLLPLARATPPPRLSFPDAVDPRR